MICEVRDNGNEIVLKNVTFADILAMVTIWICKDKELCFTNPSKGENER